MDLFEVLMAENRRWARSERSEQSQRVYFICMTSCNDF